MFTSILLAVAINPMTQNPMPLTLTQPAARTVQSQAVQFDAIGLQADIHAELLQQIQQLSQAISNNIEEGVLATAPVELITVKD
ncbi:hypothetical protein [Shewanella sp.]|uniref:hypothetical protein n=1 Tax=Shewanella sp. TaxID=50422 RepID=UPI003A86E85E